jgi:hypothetical protein
MAVASWAIIDKICGPISWSNDQLHLSRIRFPNGLSFQLPVSRGRIRFVFDVCGRWPSFLRTGPRRKCAAAQHET